MASKPKKPRKAKATGYKMPAPIPTGFVVKNSQKKAWVIGTSIGKGGFGEIYSCAAVDDNAPTKSKTKGSASYPYAIKIEPQENGPLFVEMHFYMKVAKKEDVENWMKTKGIKRLGMPCLEGSGSFEYDNERYRFIVMDRFGQDLWSLFCQNQKLFPLQTGLQLGLQIIDVLEYIHDQGYAHCDLKGSNILLGTQKGTEDQAYLVDFGLASRYSTTDFKPDPKKAHNGTIEYTSRDAHQGVITRRGDMEILGFNLLHWATSTLPWDTVTDPKVAEEKKKSLMEKVSTAAKKLVPSAPPVIIKYLEYVGQLKHDQAPDYEFCRKLFKDELKKIGQPANGKLVFKVDSKVNKTPKKTSAVGRKRNVTKGKNTTEGEYDKENDDGDIIKEDCAPKKKTVKKTLAVGRKRNVTNGKNTTEGEYDNESDDGDDIEENCASKKKTVKKSSAVGGKRNVTNEKNTTEQENDKDDNGDGIEEDCAPKKKTVKKTSAVVKKRNIANGNRTSESEDEEDDDERKKGRASKKTKKGPSWKDCETAKTSGVTKAGEYVSSKPARRKKL